MYSKKRLSGQFYTTKGFYIFYIPVSVPYKKIYGMATDAGLKKTQEFGPILEEGKMFGFGWIGIEVQKPTNNHQDVKHIDEQFEVYEHKGPYKTIGQACKKISKDRPGTRPYYNLYLDDPEKVGADACRTEIYFR